LFLLVSAFLGALGVLLGAFGAHALRQRLTPELLRAFETGVLYHFLHALALGLVALALTTKRFPTGALTFSGWLFIAGVVLFSGSLYALALSGVKGLGAITPIGGICFVAGWVSLAVGAWRAH